MTNEQIDPVEETQEEKKNTIIVGTIGHAGHNGLRSQALMALMKSLPAEVILAEDDKVLIVNDDPTSLSKMLSNIREEEPCQISSDSGFDKGYSKPHKHKGGHKANARKAKKGKR